MLLHLAFELPPWLSPRSCFLPASSPWLQPSFLLHVSSSGDSSPRNPAPQMCCLTSGWRLWRTFRQQTALAGNESFEGSTLLPAPVIRFSFSCSWCPLFCRGCGGFTCFFQERRRKIRPDRATSLKALGTRLLPEAQSHPAGAGYVARHEIDRPPKSLLLVWFASGLSLRRWGGSMCSRVLPVATCIAQYSQRVRDGIGTRST